MIFIGAQIVGFIAMIFIILSFQNNSKKKILAFQVFSAGIFTVHFIMLGAYTGAVLNALEIGRNIIFWKFDNAKQNTLWVLVFSTLFAVVGILSWQNMWSLLPVLGQCLATVAFSLRKPQRIRFCYVPVCALWLAYNIVSLSIAGIITEGFSLISLIVAIWRFRKGGNYDEQGTNT